MPRRRALLLTLGSIGLAASIALGLRAAWSSPRQTIQIDIPATSLGSPGMRPAEGPTRRGLSVPAFAVHLDLPVALMRGRPERLALRLEAPVAGEALTLAAGIVSAEMSIRPSGESGQAFGSGAGFAASLINREGVAGRGVRLRTGVRPRRSSVLRKRTHSGPRRKIFDGKELRTPRASPSF